MFKVSLASLIFLLLAVGSLTNHATAAEEQPEGLRVLWLGTGFSFYNQLDDQVVEWMGNAGHPWNHDAVYLWPLSRLLDDEPDRWSPKKTSPGDVRAMVESGDYDVLLIQCKTEYFSEDDKQGPEVEKMNPVFDWLVDTARANGGVPILYSTERPWIRNGKLRGDDNHDRLIEAARRKNVFVVDSYEASKRMMLDHPEVTFIPEHHDSHPMGPETYLSLCLFHAAMLGEDPAAADLPLQCIHAPIAFDENGERDGRLNKLEDGTRPILEVSLEDAAVMWQVAQEVAAAERAVVGLEPGQLAWEALD